MGTREFFFLSLGIGHGILLGGYQQKKSGDLDPDFGLAFSASLPHCVAGKKRVSCVKTTRKCFYDYYSVFFPLIFMIIMTLMSVK